LAKNNVSKDLSLVAVDIISKKRLQTKLGQSVEN